MDTAAATNTSTFEPSYDLIKEDDCNTLLLYLPGFTKEQLRVLLTRTRVLKISGIRPLGNNRWSSFEKDFPIFENCDTNKITAKFEEGILYVRQPKENKKLPAAAATEIPQPHKSTEERPPPPPAKIDPPPRQPTPLKQADPKSSPKKPVQSKEEIRSEKSSSERDGGKIKKEELGKRAAEKSRGDEKRAAEKRVKGAGRVEADYNKLTTASPAARLKAARKKVANILLLVSVFALGVYVSRLSWFSKD